MRCRGTVLAAVASVGAMAAAAPAAADWQYSRWGMTADQVAAASSGVARPNPDRALDVPGLRAALSAPYQGSALPFTAVFLFDAGDALRTVELVPVGDIACPVIVEVLGAHYGRPEGEADMGRATTLRWDDAENDNLVVYSDLGRGHCTIQYSHLPPTKPSGKGL